MSSLHHVSVDRLALGESPNQPHPTSPNRRGGGSIRLRHSSPRQIPSASHWGLSRLFPDARTRDALIPGRQFAHQRAFTRGVSGVRITRHRGPCHQRCLPGPIDTIGRAVASIDKLAGCMVPSAPASADCRQALLLTALCQRRRRFRTTIPSSDKAPCAAPFRSRVRSLRQPSGSARPRRGQRPAPR